MQKKLIALAVAGLMAAPAVMAQSNVTVYGRMDIGVTSTDDNVGDRLTKVDNSLWTTSRLGFRGTEDLGNGLKAIFQIESRLQNDRDADLNTNRDTFVGLSGGFGTLMLGRNSTPLNSWLTSYDHNGSNAFRTTAVLTEGDLETRVDNSIVYASPVMGGLQAAVLYAPDEDASVKSDVSGIGLQYKNGPIAVAYTYHQVDNDVKNQFLAGSYDFGVAKIVANMQNNKFDGVSEREKEWGLGLSAPVSQAGRVSIGYSKTTSIGGVKDADGEVAAVSYVHALSQRTSVYTGYQRQDVDGSENKDTFGVGVFHMF